MDKQALFDKAAKGIIAQNGFGYEYEVGCRYKLPNGCRCAVGQLMPDEAADRYANNNYSVSLILQKDAALRELWQVEGLHDELFLRELQAVHDNAAKHFDTDNRIVYWRTYMRSVATTYGLNTEVLDA